jgi:acyl-CoA thioester hydrolase
MVNETRGVLSSTFECVNAHADLTIRRTAPYPAHIAAQIDALIGEHNRLDWQAPTCGAMKP